MKPLSRKQFTLCALLTILALGGLTTYLYQSTNLFHRFTKSSDEPKKPEWVAPEAPYVKNRDRGPDVTITSKKLSDLPQDILKIPVLKELLTEDFVFYYQETSTALSVEGSLKRIAFEHNLTVQDQLVKFLLSSAAEVGIWKSYNGKLEDFMLVLDTPVLAELSKTLDLVAAQDQQLTKLPTLTDSDWPSPVYKLQIQPKQALYITAEYGKLIVFNNEKLPLPTKGRLKLWSEATQAQFGSAPNIGTFSRRFQNEPETSKHSVYVSTDYLAFGYQALLKASPAFRFTFDEQHSWQGNALTPKRDQDHPLISSALWSSVPKDASLCLALPLDDQHINELIDSSLGSNTSAGQRIFANIDRTVAACWYASSKLFTPLFVARANKPLDANALKSIFEESTGNLEAGILTAEEKAKLVLQKEMILKGETIEDPVRPKSYEQALPVVETKLPSGVSWTRDISSRHGLREASESPSSDKMLSKRYFKVTLAYAKEHLIFSPDDELVTKTIQVLDKTYPALSDTLSGAPANSGALVFPGKLVELIKSSVDDTLPASQEALFRDSLARRLIPSLDKLGTSPNIALVWPSLLKSDSYHWEELKWQTLRSK